MLKYNLFTWNNFGGTEKLQNEKSSCVPFLQFSQMLTSFMIMIHL